MRQRGRKYPATFPKGTIFEFTEVTAGGVRRVDVKVSNTFYEFKSVATNGLPPDGFATQFLKDLDLAEVTDLSQIKWWFDGVKISSLSKTDFLNAINNSTINQPTINKLIPEISNPTKLDLIQKISAEFDNIFLIK